MQAYADGTMVLAGDVVKHYWPQDGWVEGAITEVDTDIVRGSWDNGTRTVSGRGCDFIFVRRGDAAEAA